MKKQTNISKNDLFILLMTNPKELLNKFICYKFYDGRIKLYIDYVYYILPCNDGHYLCNSFFIDIETSLIKEFYKEKVCFYSLNKLLNENIHIISYF